MSTRKLIRIFLLLTFWNDVLSRQFLRSNQSQLTDEQFRRRLQFARRRTFHPTRSPTLAPQVLLTPTVAPSSNHFLTRYPSLAPSGAPTEMPASPSSAPTADPTFRPSFRLTINPTRSPSAPLTASPTLNPSSLLSLTPSCAPTAAPTFRPSFRLTIDPTRSPSAPLTASPTINPTLNPSINPTTSLLSFFTTTMPSQQPTHHPTQLPASSKTSPTVGNLLVILLVLFFSCLGVGALILAYYYQRQKICRGIGCAQQASLETSAPLPILSTPIYSGSMIDPAEPQPEPPASDPKWRIPRNEVTLIKEIGRGSFGVVYQGIWKHQTVAVKVFVNQSNLSAEQNQEIPHEVAIMQRLQHECLVRFFGLVQEIAHPVMVVMACGLSGSLESYLHDDLQEIPWWLRLRIAHELARGLAYLHEENIIHRDIKSSNVVLNSDYHAMWCDFGFAYLRPGATLASSANIEIGNAAGTLRWMAPERLRSPSVALSVKSDIWSFGMVLFELASREIPFASKQTIESVMAAINSNNGERVPWECEQHVPEFGRTMGACWTEEDARPSAEELIPRLETLVSQHPEPPRL